MNDKVLRLLFGAVLSVTDVVPQNAQPPFSLTISTATSVFKVGSEIRITVLLKNTSDSDILYERGLGEGVEKRGEIFSDVQVLDEGGNSAPDTDYYRNLRGRAETAAKDQSLEQRKAGSEASDAPRPRPSFRGSFTGFMLKPGESREEEITVTRLYDFRQPGRYRVSISRQLPSSGSRFGDKFTAKSNTLVITLVN